MANNDVRIDDDTFSDPRIELLGMLAGYNRFEALGRLAHLWRVCVQRETDVLEDYWTAACLGVDGSRWLVKAELGESIQGGTRIRWASGRNEKAESLVYFIREPLSHTLKIGSAIDPDARLKQLQTSCPMALRLLGTMRGGQPQEREYHRRFAQQRIREDGEWFRIDGDLLAFLNAQGWL